MAKVRKKGKEVSLEPTKKIQELKKEIVTPISENNNEADKIKQCFLFKYPSLYNLKLKLTMAINKDKDLCKDFPQYIKNQKVLDAGCGPKTRLYDETLAKELTGMDQSEEFIKERGNGIVGDIANMPFENSYFDTSLVLFTLHHSGNMLKILKELKRVTKGHIIVLDHIKHENPLLKAIQLTTWKIIDRGVRYNSLDEWLKLFKESKLSVVKVQRKGLLFRQMVKWILKTT